MISPLTAVLGVHLSVAVELVTALAVRLPGIDGGVCVVTTVTSGAGALR